MESERGESTASEDSEPAEVLEGSEPLAVSDARLLERFVLVQEGPAFAEIVRRHQRLVMGACQRILQDPQAAEDAFQETFLTLARRARSIRIPESLAGWLHRVASNSALQMRIRNQRRSARESLSAVKDVSLPADPETRRLSLLLDETLDELPDKYRLPLILCYLQGLTNETAAERLGHPKGSMSTLIARGLDLMRAGLRKKGVAVSGAIVAAAFATSAQAVAPSLAASLLSSLPAAGWTLALRLKVAAAAAILAAGAVGTGLLPPPASAPDAVVNAPPPSTPAAAPRPVPFSIPDPAALLPRIPEPAPPVGSTSPAAEEPKHEPGPPAPESLPPLPDLPATVSERAQAALKHALERRVERGPADAPGGPSKHGAPEGTGPKAPKVSPGQERAREAGLAASAAAEQAQQAVQQARGRSGK